jgi:molybdopterin-containing oxidoreductase family membrane subunit
MVLTLAIPVRKLFHLEDFITARHLDNMGKVMLATGLIVAYGYMTETFMAWYSVDTYERYMMWNRMFGPYGPVYAVLILCNILIPQFLWSRKVRLHVAALFSIAMAVNIGMWLERFVIVVVSLHRDFMPSAWGMYYPTRWDYFTFFGSIGLFLSLLFLFLRFLPLISIFEMRELVSPKPSTRSEGEA